MQARIPKDLSDVARPFLRHVGRFVCNMPIDFTASYFDNDADWIKMLSDANAATPRATLNTAMLGYNPAAVLAMRAAFDPAKRALGSAVDEHPCPIAHMGKAGGPTSPGGSAGPARRGGEARLQGGAVAVAVDLAWPQANPVRQVYQQGGQGGHAPRGRSRVRPAQQGQGQGDWKPGQKIDDKRKFLDANKLYSAGRWRRHRPVAAEGAGAVTSEAGARPHGRQQADGDEGDQGDGCPVHGGDVGILGETGK